MLLYVIIYIYMFIKIPQYIISCRYYIILHDLTLYCMILHCSTLSWITLHHFTLYYIVLDYYHNIDHILIYITSFLYHILWTIPHHISIPIVPIVNSQISQFFPHQAAESCDPSTCAPACPRTNSTLRPCRCSTPGWADAGFLSLGIWSVSSVHSCGIDNYK